MRNDRDRAIQDFRIMVRAMRHEIFSGEVITNTEAAKKEFAEWCQGVLEINRGRLNTPIFHQMLDKAFTLRIWPKVAGGLIRDAMNRYEQDRTDGKFVNEWWPLLDMTSRRNPKFVWPKDRK